MFTDDPVTKGFFDAGLGNLVARSVLPRNAETFAVLQPEIDALPLQKKTVDPALKDAQNGSMDVLKAVQPEL